LSNKLNHIFPYTNNASLKLRYMAVELFNNGKSRTEISKLLSVSRRLVNEWITKYLNGGVDALALKKSTGRPANLSSSEKERLKVFVVSHSVKSEGGRLIGQDIQEYIKNTFAVSYQLRNVYRLMSELNLSWITSRSMHPKQSIEAQEDFKKFPD